MIPVDKMPSKTHQMLQGLIIRKMSEKGYEIVAYDGKDFIIKDYKLNLPPTIIRHRPDIIGYKFETKEICIGEAKTKLDLYSKRTNEQLLDYSNAKVLSTEKQIEIIIGIPKSAETDLINILKKIGLDNKEFITILWIPDELTE